MTIETQTSNTPADQTTTTTAAPEPKVETTTRTTETPKTGEVETTTTTTETGKAWGDDWRKQASGGDAELEKRLERYTDPTALAKAFVDTQNKLRAGESKAPLAKNATPEQAAAWRKENGIPDKAADYLKNLPPEISKAIDGNVDAAAVEPFLQVMHDANVPPAQAQKLLAMYGEMQKQTETTIQNNDVTLRDKTDHELRTEWGGDYSANMKARMDLIESFPAEVQELFKNARMGDGTPMMHNKVMTQELAQIGRFMFPKGLTAPGSMSDDLKTVDGQIEGYKAQMLKDRPAWNANVEGQKHLMQLYEMKARMGK